MVRVEYLASRLALAGFVAASEEAEELLRYSNGDDVELESMVQRRLRGEPLAWITGFTMFCDLSIRVDPGVYVPRWQSEPLARRAAERLPSRGIAIDLCTGSGALAKTLLAQRPEAHVVATELDDRAVACAISNGVEVYQGDLFGPLPRQLVGVIDVVVGVVPYVPTESMSLLPRDTLVFESPNAYDGGVDGADILRRVVADSVHYLRPGGALLLELGGDEANLLHGELARLGFWDVTVLKDEDGDVRGIEATAGN
jgi:release factor glutamine methyltransferase